MSKPSKVPSTVGCNCPANASLPRVTFSDKPEVLYDEDGNLRSTSTRRKRKADQRTLH